jgi:protein TonB
VIERPILRRRTGPRLRFVPPRWTGTEARDPFGAALELHADRRTQLAAAVAAALVYGGATIFAISAKVPQPPPTRIEIPVVEALPPPPAAPSPPPEEAPPVQPRRVRRATPPPAPAQASQVVTQAADAPVDLSSFSIATGHAESYAGGYTAGIGTSHSAVSSPNAARSAPRPARAASLARTAQPARKDWSCGWPDAAQETDLRETRVAVRVDVSADGDPISAAVQGVPLAGFGEAARHCALSEQYRPALDAAGHRVMGQTPLLLVHFVR